MEELAVGDEGFVFVGGVDAVAGEDEAVDHVGGLFDEDEERSPRKGLGQQIGSVCACRSTG